MALIEGKKLSLFPAVPLLLTLTRLVAPVCMPLKKKAQAQANDAVRKEVSRQAAVEAVAEPVVEEPSSTEVVAAAAAAAAAASSSKASKPFKTRDSYSVLKTQTTASAKRPKGGDSVTSAKFWKALYNRHGRAIAVAILALILAVCVIVALMYSK